MVSVVTSQLYCYTSKATRVNIQVNEFSGVGGDQIKLYLQKQGIGWIWPAGHSFLTADLKHSLVILKAKTCWMSNLLNGSINE